ncbi:AraC family transcriptional regulator [Pandoraea terrae]|uniref:AraC family transcriptional regulator n=1 Tax=Pandoraea terrae TaxID=1537710 RepID=A0A5E4RPF0_9BURK|nr:helix-turn-helix domain-containing protein [Pandoraea terrae]VVD65266.1 AraC family transcriptional regulator [Pandoraea terrae]
MEQNGHFGTHQFSDADEHARSLVNFEQRYFQIEAGKFKSTMTQCDLDGLRLVRERTSHRVSQQGRSPADVYTIGLPVSAPSPATFQGRPLEAATLLQLRGGQEFSLHTPADTELVAIVLPEHEFGELMEYLGGAGSVAWLRAPTMQAGSATAHRACSAIRACFAHAEQNQDLLTVPAVRKALRDQIIEHLLCVLTEGETPGQPDVTRLAYSRIVKTCQEFVLANSEQPLTVTDLCQALRVSRRTLQTSFTEVTGASPAFYLRYMRLSAVRSLLRSTGATLTIRDAAAYWGFIHMGNFARDYFRMFAELPSQTCRRN